MGRYFDELKRSMEWLAAKPDTVFIGQAVADKGTAMSNTLQDISLEKRLELPVFEETQMGMTTGMALNGSVPVSIFPRWDFLICASSQLVNHLNRIREYSNDQFQPKAIIRTGIGSSRPLDPQAQHKNDYTDAFKLLLNNVEVIKLEEPDQIFPAYQKAYERTDGKSTLLVEVSDFYNEK
jgi:pyruvate/2-oxoglutarate/acetoin dehydrogenase E1 component